MRQKLREGLREDCPPKSLGASGLELAEFDLTIYSEERLGRRVSSFVRKSSVNEATINGLKWQQLSFQEA